MDQEKPSPSTEGNPSAENRGLQTRSEGGGYALPSGRTLRISAGQSHDTDQMEILSSDGQVEVEILLTPNGPMVRVHGGSLKMTSTQSIQLESAGPVEIKAEELRVRTTRSVHLDGETIRLNCQDHPAVQTHTSQAPALCEHGSSCGNHSQRPDTQQD